MSQIQPILLKVVTIIKPTTMDDEVKKIDQLFKPFEQDFKEFEIKYIQPILSIEPNSIRNFIEANENNALMDYTVLIMKIFSNPDISKEMMELTKKIGKLLNKTIPKVSVFPKNILENIKKALLLETDNEIFFMQKYGLDALKEFPYVILEENGIDIKKIGTTLSKFILTLTASYAIISSDNRKLTPSLKVLSDLSIEYAEDRDAQLCTIDIILDRKKQADLEEALSSIKK